MVYRHKSQNSLKLLEILRAIMNFTYNKCLLVNSECKVPSIVGNILMLKILKHEKWCFSVLSKWGILFFFFLHSHPSPLEYKFYKRRDFMSFIHCSYFQCVEFVWHLVCQKKLWKEERTLLSDLVALQAAGWNVLFIVASLGFQILLSYSYLNNNLLKLNNK